MNIYEALNIIPLRLFLDKSLKFEDYFNDSKIIKKDEEIIIDNKVMIISISILKKRNNYFEDTYLLNFILKDENLKNLIIYENSFNLPHTELNLYEVYKKEELDFLIKIYSECDIDKLYFTKDFNSEDIIKYVNDMILSEKIKKGSNLDKTLTLKKK